jgi:hypothetical protein
LTSVPVAVDTTFTYDIQVSFTQDGLEGYRGVKVAALPAPEYLGMEAGSPLAAVVPDSVRPTADGFEVYFAPVTRLTVKPMRLLFRQRILEHNTPVNAWLLGTRGGLPQPVSGGNANDAVTTNSIRVYTLDPKPAIKVSLSAEVFSPNGDGVNDATRITCALVQFTAEMQLEVEVFDLAGHRVRRLLSAPLSAGTYVQEWDGRDDQGSLVPPGTYLCRVKGEAQARTYTTARAVGVAY